MERNRSEAQKGVLGMKFKVGDRVKIVEFHKDDGYFGRAEDWIKETLILDAIQEHLKYSGYYYATIHTPNTGEAHYLYAVKLKPA